MIIDSNACRRIKIGRMFGRRPPRSNNRLFRVFVFQVSTVIYSVIPLPIRMGYQKQYWLTPPPDKFANIELMKIPNFLHLTPKAIYKHCDKLKGLLFVVAKLINTNLYVDFCTEWPQELDSDDAVDHHFPLRLETITYVHSGPSIRCDTRCRSLGHCHVTVVQ